VKEPEERIKSNNEEEENHDQTDQAVVLHLLQKANTKEKKLKQLGTNTYLSITLKK
jgi:hypothetical protein